LGQAHTLPTVAVHKPTGLVLQNKRKALRLLHIPPLNQTAVVVKLAAPLQHPLALAAQLGIR
jgi:hypothetical protein